MVAIVVGDATDLHVAAVVKASDPEQVLIVDAQTWFERDFEISESSWSRSGIASEQVTRGWIRRIVPPDWQTESTIGSHDSAVAAAQLAAFAHVIRACDARWVTNVDDSVIGESKLQQARVARSLNVPYPKTVVTNSRADAVALLGNHAVIKPLGPGHYTEAGVFHAVYATGVDLETIDEEAFGATPFLVQERLEAESHFRVVTTPSRAWVCTLSATTALPLDWRSSPAAHRSFEFTGGEESALGHSAVRIARAMRLGYSSQDWVRTEAGDYLLDVNPGGQWLFLPEPVAAGVAEDLAQWLGLR